MANSITKKMNNKKGFTLIELIVVIAILAILAAIAVPRFSGFRNKANIQSDNQYLALVSNSTKVMMASSVITGAGTVTITPGTGAVAYTTFTGSANADAQIITLIEIKPLKHYTAASIAFTADGVPTITTTPTYVANP